MTLIVISCLSGYIKQILRVIGTPSESSRVRAFRVSPVMALAAVRDLVVPNDLASVEVSSQHLSRAPAYTHPNALPCSSKAGLINQNQFDSDFSGLFI